MKNDTLKVEFKRILQQYSHGIQLLALDLDGTLLTDKKTISEETMDALRLAHQAGLYIVPVTGRPLAGLPAALLSLNCCRYAVTSNGAVSSDLLAGEQFLYEGLPAATALQVLRAAPELDIIREVMIDGYAYLDPASYCLIEERYLDSVFREYVLNSKRKVPDYEMVISSFKDSFRENSHIGFGVVENLSFLTESPEELDILADALLEIPDIRVSIYSSTSLEVGSPRAHKGSTLLKLAASLGLSRKEICAVGDSANDIPMLQVSGVSVAMGNAAPQVKEIAAFITRDNNHDGIADIIHAILARR